MSNGSLGRGLGSLIPNAGTRGATLRPAAPEPTTRVLDLPISQISANPSQPRRVIDHDALEDLISSIREHGILQPLIVVKTGRGYQLIAGERRFRSAQIIGLKTVPAMVRDATTQQQLEVAVVENVQRKDLNPLERAAAYRKLMAEFGLTQEQVAKRVGKSRVSIANTIRILDLPKEVQAAVANEQISEGHAKVIASAATPKEQLRVLSKILEKRLSVRAGEALVVTPRGGRRHRPANPEFIALEEELRDRFGTRVRVDRHGKVGTITLEFYSTEELRMILQRLRRS